MSGEEITEVLRSEDTTFPDELVAAGVEVCLDHDRVSEDLHLCT
jgi:hypothetical protein